MLPNNRRAILTGAIRHRQSAASTVPRSPHPAAHDSQIPIAALRRHRARIDARFPPLEVFGRRTPQHVHCRPRARHPKTFTEPVIATDTPAQTLLKNPVCWRGGWRRPLPGTADARRKTQNCRSGAVPPVAVARATGVHWGEVQRRRQAMTGLGRKLLMAGILAWGV